ncbi:hypothetical protein Q5H92_14775 [Hymenobacter sp. M29]|uniref:Crassvirus muzzle protein N-terminal region domain-containing protein n=1 Tax=Hymenobacter mellowenesis TaxID=3063995 RepID=A0ABT9ACS0_9BACT|nr:hypothetical protein [Hymenobacter sp. M29]MDO7847630.1 hypothetical protein [Hymenobacter sp. M29]
MYQADFTKGWHSDFDPIDQPSQTYRRLVNGIRGLGGTIESEPGQELLSPLGDLKLLGHYTLGPDIVLFLSDGTTHQVTVLDSQDQFQNILNHPDLNFSLAHRISVEGKLNFKGERVVYFADGYNPLRYLNLDSPPTVDVANNLKLMTSASLPIPQWLEQVEGGGSVPTGVYQVVARQLTRSTNPTGFGLTSEVLSVVDENRAVGRDQYDGGLPQTPTTKALQVRFTNLDPDYPFLEPVIITYQGTGNQFTAYTLPVVQLNGRTEYTLTYRGESQHQKEVLLEELVSQPTRYTSALTLSQKDGILVASNLQAQGRPDFSFQTFANAVTLTYTITEVVVGDNFLDYKGELPSATLRGYRRGETYAFGLSPLYQDYQDTTAYHIPASHYVGTGTQELDEVGYVDRANTTTKALGTYQSTDDYPTGFDYPTGKVRYHVMPTVEQEPLLVTRGGVTYLRILGVVADFTSAHALLPADGIPGLTGFNLVRMSRTPENSRVLTQGIAQQHLDRNTDTGLSGWAGHAPGQNQNPTYRANLLGFFSPETVILGQVPTTAQYIKGVAQLAGDQVNVAQKRDNASTGLYFHLLLDYKAQTVFPSGGPYSGTLVASLTDRVPAGIDHEAGVSTYDLKDGSLTLTTTETPGYVLLKTTQNLSFNTRLYGDGKAETYYKVEANATDGVYANGNNVDGASYLQVVGDTQRFLYNLTTANPAQYGRVEDGTYHRVGTWSLSPTALTQSFWGGDTFLGKFAVVVNQPYLQVLADARSLQYFWCESSVNVNYRHYLRRVGEPGDADYQAGTLPCYPKYPKLWEEDTSKPLGLLNYSPSLGHPTGYNRQYSFEDQLLSYFPTGLTEEEVTQFPNRSIYSQQSVEGEQVDAYRQFLPNDYQDVPKSHGPITQTFVLGGTFGWHTSRGLWKGFFNEQVSQAASNGEVYLGTGGVFSRPPVLVVDGEGGYAGCQGQWGLTTPYGHFFPDTQHRKVWKLTPGWELQDLTKQGIRQWADTHLTPVPDQPGLDSGYTLGWDYHRDRLLLTKLTTPAQTP